MYFRWSARDQEKRQQEARRRELLVLIHHHLQEEGFIDAAQVLGNAVIQIMIQKYRKKREISFTLEYRNDNLRI